MRLDLEVLGLAEDLLRHEARQAEAKDLFDYAEHIEGIADDLADLIEAMEQDG